MEILNNSYLIANEFHIQREISVYSWLSLTYIYNIHVILLVLTIWKPILKMEVGNFSVCFLSTAHRLTTYSYYMFFN